MLTVSQLAGQRSLLGYFAAGFSSCKMSERTCCDGEADVGCPTKQHKAAVVWRQRVRIECMFFPLFHNVWCVKYNLPEVVTTNNVTSEVVHSFCRMVHGWSMLEYFQSLCKERRRRRRGSRFAALEVASGCNGHKPVVGGRPSLDEDEAWTLKMR